MTEQVNQFNQWINLADYTTALVKGDVDYLRNNTEYVDAINGLISGELVWDINNHDIEVFSRLIKNAANLEHHAQYRTDDGTSFLCQEDSDNLTEYLYGYFGENGYGTDDKPSLTSLLAYALTVAIEVGTGYSMQLGLDKMFSVYHELLRESAGFDLSLGYLHDTLDHLVETADGIPEDTPDHFEFLVNSNILCFNLSNALNQTINPVVREYEEFYGTDHPVVHVLQHLYIEIAETTKALAETTWLVDLRFRSTHALTLLLNTISHHHLSAGVFHE